MRIAYLDCFSGVSGNMLLGAILDAGFPEESLRKTLSRLPVSGYILDIKRKNSAGLSACQVTVSCGEEQPHRHLRDIVSILDSTDLDEQVRQQSLAIFTRLAHAEASVHGTTPDTIHFHEVGAVDALIDVVGTVAGFAALGIENLICSPLPMPHGWVTCAHGTLPLPAPAVCALLKDTPVYGEQLDQELVTPTGAAIVCELADSFGPMPPMILHNTSYGAGSMERHDRRPNLLRCIIGERVPAAEAAQVEVIETHLDDWSPETWPYVSEQLMENGALDVSLTHIQMKKGRPGYLIKVLSDAAHAGRLKDILLSETSAIGLRFHTEHRMTLPRRAVTVDTPWGPVQAKEIETPKGPVITPEYESCKKLAAKQNISLQTIYRKVVQCAEQRSK